MKTKNKFRRIISYMVSGFATLVLAAALLPSARAGGELSAKAATKRTAVVTSLLTSRGKINSADWNVKGDPSAPSISNNGKVFRVTGAPWPGYRIAMYNTVPAGESYNVELDVLKTNPSTTKLNLSGFVENINSGAVSNIYLSSLGIDVGLGTNYGANGDGSAVWNGVNTTLNAGYRYRFTFGINAENASYGDFIISTKPLGDEAAEWTEGCVLTKLCSINDAAHMAHIYFEGDITIDNLLLAKTDGTKIQETDFSDASVLDGTGVATADKIYFNGGGIVNDTYLSLKGVSSEDKIVSYLKAEPDSSLENAFLLNASVKVGSTAGKAGLVLGLPDENAACDASGASFLYFENEGAVTKMNLLADGEAQTAVELSSLSDDFHALKIEGKNDGKMLVYIDGGLKATYEGRSFVGHVGLMTDGNEGAEISFLPDFTVDTYKVEVGTGADLENNFNTGYINPANYENDTHPAVSLGGNARGIVAEDGILKFAGTSDGTHFAINGVYADFILQFDWINYAWADRPTDGDGKVFYKDKPESGLATELYSPLGIAFGKATPTAGWADAKLLRLFDTYNLIQFINGNEGGVTYNTPMGRSIASAEDCADIQDGKIAFYEQTVNIKLVARNGALKVYGVGMENGEPAGTHVLLAEFAYENCTGYISLSTSEAGYFGIDNLRITKIDGWTEEQIAAYENFKTIADEAAPEKLSAPVVSVDGTTVSWNAVEGATGYVVTVNGTSGEAITQTSYTPAETADGQYTVTVKAIGDGVVYLDSDESEAVTLTIGGSSGDSSGGGSSSEGNSSGSGSGSSSDGNVGVNSGCGSAVGFSVGAAALVGLAAAVLLKKKEN